MTEPKVQPIYKGGLPSSRARGEKTRKTPHPQDTQNTHTPVILKAFLNHNGISGGCGSCTSWRLRLDIKNTTVPTQTKMTVTANSKMKNVDKTITF